MPLATLFQGGETKGEENTFGRGRNTCGEGPRVWMLQLCGKGWAIPPCQAARKKTRGSLEVAKALRGCYSHSCNSAAVVRARGVRQQCREHPSQDRAYLGACRWRSWVQCPPSPSSQPCHPAVVCKRRGRGPLGGVGRCGLSRNPPTVGRALASQVVTWLLTFCLGHTYDRSIMVDGEEASLMVYDIWEQDGGRWLPGHCMAMGDAYVIVYSVTDKGSFEKASELRVQLRRARQTDDVPIILVGNKSDLVRSREVSVDEGRACAVVFDCKFIETSAALHHNVQALFEGIVRQIRLRRDSKEANARRQAGARRRESLGKKAKRFLGRIVARNSRKMAFRAKSKSCHDLSVL
uniref:GTP-binding protein REM 2 n=1 Tax=Oryctolagus cuniculus TaxID=9986 RepID=A0A5F9C4C3_RABIT